MKIRLLRRAKIWHESGEVVEASPEEASFLISVKSAEPVREAPEEKRKKDKPKSKE